MQVQIQKLRGFQMERSQSFAATNQSIGQAQALRQKESFQARTTGNEVPGAQETAGSLSSAMLQTVGQVRSPTPARRSSSKLSRRPVRSTVRRCSHHCQRRTVADHLRSDRSKNSHSRKAMGRRPVAERAVCRGLAQRHAQCKAGHIPETGVVIRHQNSGAEWPVGFSRQAISSERF